MKIKTNLKKAFTLAETLIAMGIIGVVAALTIPVLMSDYQERTMSTAKTAFCRTFGEALKIMNSQEVLAGYKTTEDFVAKLSEYYKIATVCDTTPTDCFSKTILWGDDEKEIDMTSKTKAGDIVDYADGEADWGTDIVGLRFMNGVTALLVYNPKCTQNKYNGDLIKLSGTIGDNGRTGNVSFSTNNCVAMIYDVNGNTVPNRNEMDISLTENVKSLEPIDNSSEPDTE